MPLPIVDDVLSKEMDRKEFLMHVGAGLLAVIGISGILKSIKEDNRPSAAGYGTSVYGGGKSDR